VPAFGICQGVLQRVRQARAVAWIAQAKELAFDRWERRRWAAEDGVVDAVATDAAQQADAGHENRHDEPRGSLDGKRQTPIHGQEADGGQHERDAREGVIRKHGDRLVDADERVIVS
jgi:hypothetical protein